MSRLDCFLQPALDDPGEWRIDPILEPRQQEQLLRLFATTAQSLGNALERELGPALRVMNLPGFLRSIVPDSCYEPDAALCLRLLAMQDYNAHRGYAPRMRPGGPVEKTNRNIWRRWQPWLQQQLLEAQQRNVRDSLLWRCQLARVPEQLIPNAPVAAALRETVQALGGFDVQDVQLDLRHPTLGGTRWIAQAQQQELNGILDQLRQQRPVLVELIRDCNSLLPFRDLVLVTAADSRNPVQVRLDYVHPQWNRQRLDLRLAEDGVHIIGDSALPQGKADFSVKAFRVWRCAGARPPWFGLRRHIPTLLPWRILWWLRHAVSARPDAT